MVPGGIIPMMLPMLLLAALPAAAEPDVLVDFDQQKSQIEAVVRRARQEAVNFGGLPVKAPALLSPEGDACKALSFIPGEAPAPDLRPAAFCSTERDCVDFIFEPQDTQTEYFPLRSTEWREQCRYGPRGERDCWCQSQWTTSARVQIRIQDRKPMLPWERERFRMCLEGNWINYYEIAAAFEYDAKFIDRTGIVVAVTKNKIPMRPDADGIEFKSWTFSGVGREGKFSVTLADKWASYYAGETTVIKAALKKKVFLGSRTVMEKELRLTPAGTYTVEFEGKFEDAKYFVDWSFQRLGKVSTDKVIDKDDTPVIELNKTPTASAAR